MKKILLFLALIFLLLFYIWQHSISFKLTQESERLNKKNQRLREEFLILKAEVDRLTSYNSIIQKAKGKGLVFNE